MMIKVLSNVKLEREKLVVMSYFLEICQRISRLLMLKVWKRLGCGLLPRRAFIILRRIPSVSRTESFPHHALKKSWHFTPNPNTQSVPCLNFYEAAGNLGECQDFWMPRLSAAHVNLTPFREDGCARHLTHAKTFSLCVPLISQRMRVWIRDWADCRVEIPGYPAPRDNSDDTLFFQGPAVRHKQNSISRILPSFPHNYLIFFSLRYEVKQRCNSDTIRMIISYILPSDTIWAAIYTSFAKI